VCCNTTLCFYSRPLLSFHSHFCFDGTTNNIDIREHKKATDPNTPAATPEGRRSTSPVSSLKREGSVSRVTSPPKPALDDRRGEFDRGTS
jgi:hypothetical protein